MDQVLVAMSGGVDSSAAAALLKEDGYKVVGCSMQLWNYERNPSKNGKPQFGKCCSLDDVYDARRVADHLGFPFYIINLQKDFEQTVVRPFVSDYLSGRTPIPCIACNTFLKFDKLLVFAHKIGIESVATGHYARVVYDPSEGYMLLRGADASKDQSYYLFELKQSQLQHILFPVGDYEKKKIRKIASSCGLLTAEKPESQEICFIPDGKYADFVRRHAVDDDDQITQHSLQGLEAGPILFKDGTTLGTHTGIHQFTIGQRRGLGITHHQPLYVQRLEPHRNAVIVGYWEDLYSSGLIADRVSWISSRWPESAFRANVRIRSRHTEAPALVKLEKANTEGTDVWRARIIFESPQISVTPGQAAVFYDGERVLGGGWISQRIN